MPINRNSAVVNSAVRILKEKNNQSIIECLTWAGDQAICDSEGFAEFKVLLHFLRNSYIITDSDSYD